MAQNSSSNNKMRRLAVPISEPTVKRPLYPSLTKSATVGHTQGKRVVLETEKQHGGGGGKNELLLAVNGGGEKSSRRLSLSEVKVELGKFMVNNGAKVMSADMPPFIQIHAVGFARKVKDSLEKFSSKTLASSLKKEFDGVYGPAWHCIVGSSFGSFVTHSVGGFLYFSLDQKLYVLLFKTSVQRAD